MTKRIFLRRAQDHRGGDDSYGSKHQSRLITLPLLLGVLFNLIRRVTLTLRKKSQHPLCTQATQKSRLNSCQKDVLHDIKDIGNKSGQCLLELRKVKLLGEIDRFIVGAHFGIIFGNVKTWDNMVMWELLQ